MKTNYIILLFLVLSLFSCSNRDNIVGEEVPKKKEFNLKIKVDKSQANIFENVQFSIGVKTDEPDLVNYLRNNFDSIIFKIPGEMGSLRVFEKTENGNSLKLSWAHNFYNAGNQQTKFFGYEDGKVIFEDKVDINITDNNDFLNINWNDFKKSETAIGYANSLNYNTLGTYNGLQNKIGFVELFNLLGKY
ncbi:hypothetical protein [Halpernia frigidisoli]|uniref:Lipoprotein n=1 Tax=Halpernia frigidisoli TaxID=1125876 RepID=A0A1I3HUM7_9FLAO|nr:hypothetical protein [Halpernia frigidisoli]SFI39362.1 hypothetical protein SAMN05443292_2398 [Halpernia frigidisoli]